MGRIWFRPQFYYLLYFCFPTLCTSVLFYILFWVSHFYSYICVYMFPGGSDGKESTCNAWELGLIPGLGRSPGEGNGYPLCYSCLENFMDCGAWQAIVHGVTNSKMWLSDTYRYTHTHIHILVFSNYWIFFLVAVEIAICTQTFTVY